EAEDMVAGDPVLEAVRPPRVGRDVAADGRHHLARRVRGEEPAPRLHGLREREVDESGLDGRTPVWQVHLEDSVHPVEPDHHAARRGHGAADEPGARAAWHDGYERLAAEPDD